MRGIAVTGIILMILGGLICFANSGGLLLFLKLRNLQRHGVEGEAVSTLQEWISKGHRVYYDLKLPEGSPLTSFIEVGAEPRGPVGAVVPVVYDRRQPKRAKTGTLADIEVAEELFYVKVFWVPGLACVVLGAVLALVFW
ncbi:hypothetical protein [Streptomyces griseoluteus]|uniref:hypothetical protein n=1 Tax=Streptomyces griseoluteus TaxID=29306 RepID=UPI003436EEA9